MGHANLRRYYRQKSQQDITAQDAKHQVEVNIIILFFMPTSSQRKFASQRGTAVYEATPNVPIGSWLVKYFKLTPNHASAYLTKKMKYTHKTKSDTYEGKITTAILFHSFFSLNYFSKPGV